MSRLGGGTEGGFKVGREGLRQTGSLQWYLSSANVRICNDGRAEAGSGKSKWESGKGGGGGTE